MNNITHCWKDGPVERDGMSTSCILLDGHEGPHEWARDNEVLITFKSTKQKKDDITVEGLRRETGDEV